MTDRLLPDQPVANPRTLLYKERPPTQMSSVQASRFWHPATQCLVGGIGVASVTFVCFQLKANDATASFAYLILIALLSP